MSVFFIFPIVKRENCLTLDRSLMRRISFVFPLRQMCSLSSATSASSSKIGGFVQSDILPREKQSANQPLISQCTKYHHILNHSEFLYILLHTLQICQNLPVIEEEAILEEYVEDEIHKSFDSHAEQVLPDKIPVVGVWTVLLTWTNNVVIDI